jgi:hypothetical protein
MTFTPWADVLMVIMHDSQENIYWWKSQYALINLFKRKYV